MKVERKIYLPAAFDINGFYPAVYGLVFDNGSYKNCITDEDIQIWNNISEGDEF